MPNSLPRAPAGSTSVVIDAAVWNEVMDRIERLERMQVTSPLYFSDDTRAGRTIAVKTPPKERVLVRFDAKVAGYGGQYTGYTVRPNPGGSGGTYGAVGAIDFLSEHAGEIAPCVIYVYDEHSTVAGGSSNWVKLGSYAWGDKDAYAGAGSEASLRGLPAVHVSRATCREPVIGDQVTFTPTAPPTTGDTREWNRHASDGGASTFGEPIVLRLATSIKWSGTQLSQWFRDVHVASDGRITKIKPESAFVVNNGTALSGGGGSGNLVYD